MKRWQFIAPLALFVVLLGFLAVGLKLDPREVPSPLIGKPAPAFALTRLDDEGKTIRREDMLGKVWMLNVWASWCAACRDASHGHRRSAAVRRPRTASSRTLLLARVHRIQDDLLPALAGLVPRVRHGTELIGYSHRRKEMR